MARKRRKKRKLAEKASISTAEKFHRVLGMFLIKGVDTEEAAVKLSGAGFDASEISEMLLVNKNYVNVAKARWKKKSKAAARIKS